ncbi:hypothetical protein VIGAN_04145700 [Vigna angularis var. angularis]|uniref:ELM2 domain-containing protein n=1 Tax=Vigna angularis var. angularis TaxID=157739 RepID=A0A0S3RU76_PHAAN|nr:hypothetical protein VIGAN_04145700 [Vigna angularis var. angularis]
MVLNQTHNKSLSDDNEIPRPVIPIGPRFQAEVPKWEGTTNVNNDDDSKWSGVQVWPMPNISENSIEGTGKGRLGGSIECVKLHIREARELLKLEIGATFSSWKFDEMGEEFSQSWTLEEDKKFESMMKLNTSSKTRNFWKLALKHFPSKSLKCMKSGPKPKRPPLSGKLPLSGTSAKSIFPSAELTGVPECLSAVNYR